MAKRIHGGVIKPLDVVLAWTNAGYDAIYVNGELKDANHGLRMEHVLKAIGVPFKSVHWDEAQSEKMGEPPVDLKKLKIEKE